APTLRALVAGRDTAVAANAAFALGLLRDSSGVADLARALDGPPSVAAVAAWSLGAIGGAAAPAIRRALGAQHAAGVTWALLLAAAKLRPVPVADVRPYFHNADAGLRWAAVYAVSRSPVSAAARDVMPLASDPDPNVRAQVARALSHRAAGDSLASLVRPVLERLVTDSAAHVRIEALRAAVTYGDAARALVLAAVHDRDGNVRLTAAQSLGMVLDGPRGVDAALARRHRLRVPRRRPHRRDVARCRAARRRVRRPRLVGPQRRLAISRRRRQRRRGGALHRAHAADLAPRHARPRPARARGRLRRARPARRHGRGASVAAAIHVLWPNGPRSVRPCARRRRAHRTRHRRRAPARLGRLAPCRLRLDRRCAHRARALCRQRMEARQRGLRRFAPSRAAHRARAQPT